MDSFRYSFIIPVYNRPDEMEELLESLSSQTYQGDFEVVVIEDGSQISSRHIVEKYEKRCSLLYLSKENTGPGDSRNYGMRRASGNYFIILDSDCIVPASYLQRVDEFLKRSYVDCFGGADAASEEFTAIQKAINYTMTSFFTTGGIRGSKNRVQRFEPRSFNMGLSREAFERTGGFGRIHPGEDPDLVIRLWKAGFSTAFIPSAFVYHKRRISWRSFARQVYKFGQVRAILNCWHQESRKPAFWFPSIFSLGLISVIFASFLGYRLGLYLYVGYFSLIMIDSALKNRSLRIGFLSVIALLIQMSGYGYGFLKAKIKMTLSNKLPLEQLFPQLFF